MTWGSCNRVWDGKWRREYGNDMEPLKLPLNLIRTWLSLRSSQLHLVYICGHCKQNHLRDRLKSTGVFYLRRGGFAHYQVDLTPNWALNYLFLSLSDIQRRVFVSSPRDLLHVSRGIRSSPPPWAVYKSFLFILAPLACLFSDISRG